MRKSRRHPQAEPWDLFYPLPQEPTWVKLPPLVLRQVTELLARLLHDHRERDVLPERGKEVGHE